MKKYFNERAACVCVCVDVDNQDQSEGSKSTSQSFSSVWLGTIRFAIPTAYWNKERMVGTE